MAASAGVAPCLCRRRSQLGLQTISARSLSPSGQMSDRSDGSSTGSAPLRWRAFASVRRGSSGKVTKVSLSGAIRDAHTPNDFELYMPHSWADDKKRRKAARVTDSLEFKAKPQLAMEMMRLAVKARVPRGVVLADAPYGSFYAARCGCGAVVSGKPPSASY